MTSPRAVKSVRRIFNTPQPNRAKSFNFTSEVVPAKFEVTGSILHQVRESNMKKHKQKVIKRGHIFDEDDEDDEDDEENNIADENKAPLLAVSFVKKKKKNTPNTYCLLEAKP